MADSSASAASSASSAPPLPCRFKTEFEKSVLVSNFESLGWKRTDSDRDWHFFWASVGTVRQLFHPESGVRLADDQILNHYPNHIELTRKDLMTKNLKRYRKEVEKEVLMSMGNKEEREKEAAMAALAAHLDFFPLTFNLPNDWSVFVEEFKRASSSTSNAVWILKPNGRSQGKGVFLIHKYAQVKKLSLKIHQQQQASGGTNIRDSYVVSRYISNPLLIGGKKFDLRLYVLVTNYRPLKAYQYTEGFARLCNVKYSMDTDSLTDTEMHLTNVAIQKQGEEYNERHGNKWSVNNLRLYLEATRGFAETKKCMEGIRLIMLHSLRSVKDLILNDKHCFECYGFDILIDEQLKPWLIEVNASPSLSVTTKPDRRLKNNLIADLLKVVCPPDFPELGNNITHTHRERERERQK